MSITRVPMSMRFVRAPIAASSGNGEAYCWAKWWTRKYAPSAPSSSAATAKSMACNNASDALRVPDSGWSVQWPKDKNPILFTPKANIVVHDPIPPGTGGHTDPGSSRHPYSADRACPRRICGPRQGQVRGDIAFLERDHL